MNRLKSRTTRSRRTLQVAVGVVMVLLATFGTFTAVVASTGGSLPPWVDHNATPQERAALDLAHQNALAAYQQKYAPAAAARAAAARAKPIVVPSTEAPLCTPGVTPHITPVISSPPTEAPMDHSVIAVSETVIGVPNGDIVTVDSGSVSAMDKDAQLVPTSQGVFLLQTLNVCHLERDIPVKVEVPGGHGPAKIVAVSGQTVRYLSADGTSGQLDVETHSVG